MQSVWRVLPYDNSLYLQSIAAGLQGQTGVEILPPGSELAPDLILLVVAEGELGNALQALARYPDLPVLAVDMQRHRLTVLRAFSEPAQTPLDLLKAIQNLSIRPSVSPSEESQPHA